jgi:tRNA-Thr(GGU) m(6)t(6)A37 methyltransferase TsaA
MPALPPLKPIGLVHNEIKEKGRHDWENIRSRIVIDSKYEEALDGLEEFSHIIVLFWMHKSPPGEQSPLKTRPQMRADLPLVGILATRSPVRPNPFGITTARLINRNKNELKVQELDAIDGTPVIDIKPCLYGNAVKDIMVPEWVHRLRKSEKESKE